MFNMHFPISNKEVLIAYHNGLSMQRTHSVVLQGSVPLLILSTQREIFRVNV